MILSYKVEVTRFVSKTDPKYIQSILVDANDNIVISNLIGHGLWIEKGLPIPYNILKKSTMNDPMLWLWNLVAVNKVLLVSGVLSKLQ